MGLIFEALKDTHIKDAAVLALECYEKERMEVPALPGFNGIDLLCKMISHMNCHELGVVAVEGSTLVGFLTCYGPLSNYFGTSDGIFSPMHAHGAVDKGHAKIYSMLYQEASKRWVGHGLLSHAIALYSHDDEAVRVFFYSGFGLRCVDAVRPLTKIPFNYVEGYTYGECDPGDYMAIADFENVLVNHFRSAPMFMPRNPNKDEKSIERAVKEEGSRFFIIKHEGSPVGFLKISDEGENFASEMPDMKNICGAYLLPEHRSGGVFGNLLSYVSDILIGEGCNRLGVDYESFNPTANAFWTKYFTPYTFSVTRRIDERIYEGQK